MIAIIDFKGQQIKIKKDLIVKVPFLKGEKKGNEIEIDNVILLGNGKKTKIGKPNVRNAKVIAEILEHKKDKKIIVFKKKRRKSYSRKKGHRQNYTEIKIKDIISDTKKT